MKGVKPLVSAFVLMIVFYLVLTQATGTGRIIGALGSNLSLLAKTFQGR
jgi:ABC-type xylose transport system permease subunit